MMRAGGFGIIFVGLIIMLLFMPIPLHHTDKNSPNYANLNTKADGYVIFTSSGLPEGSNFTVYIDHGSFKSIGSFLNISLPFGAYSYSISLPYEYHSNLSSGTVNISSNGSHILFTVTYRSYNFTAIVIATIVLSLVSILVAVGWYIKYSK